MFIQFNLIKIFIIILQGINKTLRYILEIFKNRIMNFSLENLKKKQDIKF